MSIYAIADLHLSFLENKPMEIFGDNWERHDEKIRENWLKKVQEEDYIILPGDFSWAMYLNDTILDFDYLNKLPGHKILLKGNHDYWWTTLKKLKEFVEKNKFNNIEFLYNNSYLIEERIIVGTRGWNILDTENNCKMLKRENERLELSIQDGIKKYGENKEMICFMHYPPINKNDIIKNERSIFVKTLNKYNVHKCYYGHLHGNSHRDAVEGIIDGIEYKLISADYTKFNLIEV